MAHFTKEFRRRIIFPFVMFILFVLSLIIILSIFMYWAIIFLVFPASVLTFVLIKSISIKMYKNIKLSPGTFKYVPGKLPSAWHKKMGYLRLLEIITPQEYKVKLYRKCGASIGDNVVLAGRIMEPDMTTIGENTIIGVDALVTAHEIILQNKQMVIRFAPVTIGKNCVIGAKSVILPGANIPAGTMIPAHSIIKKDHIKYVHTERGEE